MTPTTDRPAPTLDALRARRAEILALAARYRAYNVRVFGSVARGEATADSDVDFLVGVEQGVSVFELVGLWQALQDLLDCEVNLITEGISDQRFMRRIQRDVVPL